MVKEISRSGNRLYVCDTVKELPSIKDLILFTEECQTFVDSVTINPKDVNAELYSHFSEETYRIFIYAFAYKLGELRISNAYHKQFEANARRVQRLCKKRNITLSDVESKAIDSCANFSILPLLFNSKVSFSKRLCSELKELYL